MLPILLAAALMLAAAPQPAPTRACPAIKLTAPEFVVPSATYTIVAELDPPAFDDAAWKLGAFSAGLIDEGQGRAGITVLAPTDGTVTATVEVGGLPPECPAAQSVTTEVRPG